MSDARDLELRLRNAEADNAHLRRIIDKRAIGTDPLATAQRARIATLEAALDEAEKAMDEAKRCFCGCDICGRALPGINAALNRMRAAKEE